jgi:hypothetical protein
MNESFLDIFQQKKLLEPGVVESNRSSFRSLKRVNFPNPANQAFQLFCGVGTINASDAFFFFSD